MKKPALMVIGLDAVSLSLLDSFKHCTPTIRRQMRRGATGHALPCFPIYTPTNWAVIATGADATATGAVDWHRSVNGRTLSTFDSRAIAAESIFASAGRAALKTLAITYPGSYPPPTKNNLVLEPLDVGLVSNCLIPGKIIDVAASADGAFDFVLLQAPGAASGAALAKAVGATEDGADLGGGPRRRAAANTLSARVVPAGTSGWTLRVGAQTFRLRHEQWSDPIAVTVAAPGRTGRCMLRVMIFDSGKRLAVSEAYDVGRLGAPQPLAQHILDTLGPPVEHSCLSDHIRRLCGKGIRDATILRLARADLDRQARWVADAAALTMKHTPYDIFYMHHHLPDNYMHVYLAMAEGAADFTPRQHRIAREVIAMMLGVCDRMIARLLKLAGPETTVLLVSDHGDVPNRYAADIRRRLIETGLMTLTKSGDIDTRRSAAWPVGMGTKVKVARRRGSKDYRRNQDKVIDALLDWKTPDGERVVAVALRAKDVHLLGFDDREDADVAFHYNSGFFWGSTPEGTSVAPATAGANHGPQMPVTFSKLSDNMSFFVLTGPKVQRNLRWDFRTGGHIKLMDMVPTICHAAGLPTPRDVCGAVRYRLLRQ